MSFFPFLTGNMIFVNANTAIGNDSTGRRGDGRYPFLTITAALAAASAGDEVFVFPGTYNETITMPASVCLRGADVKTTIIQKAGVVAPTTLLTMGESARVESLTLNLTSTSHVTLIGSLWGGTTAATGRMRTVQMNVDNSGAGVGSSDVTGILIQSTGVADISQDIVRATTSKVTSVSSGKKRSILMDTSIATANLRDVNLYASGGTDCIGAEINIASGVLDLDNCKISGTTQDIKQTAGALFIGSAASLINTVANGSPFSSRRIGSALLYAVSGGLPAAATRYLRPGTDPVSASEIKLRVTRPAIARAISVRVVTGPGGVRTVTFTLRKNGVDTGMVLVLTGAATSAQFDTTTVDFLAGDDLSLKMDTVAGDATSDPIVLLEMY